MAHLKNGKWVLCPVRGNKTRIKARPDTVLENFPLFCPKCRQETERLGFFQRFFLQNSQNEAAASRFFNR